MKIRKIGSIHNHITMIQTKETAVARITASQPVFSALSGRPAPMFCAASMPAALPRPPERFCKNWSTLWDTDCAATARVPKGVINHISISSAMLLCMKENDAGIPIFTVRHIILPSKRKFLKVT